MLIYFLGLASSALEVLYTEQSYWKRQRIWVDPLKIGQTAGMQKAFSVFKKKKEKEKEKEKEKKRGRSSSELKEEEEEEEEGGGGGGGEKESRRRWLKYMMTANDGWRY